MDEDGFYLLYLIRDGECWIVKYTPETFQQAIEKLRDWASNQELSFTWFDAARLSLKMREEKSIYDSFF